MGRHGEHPGAGPTNAEADRGGDLLAESAHASTRPSSIQASASEDAPFRSLDPSYVVLQRIVGAIVTGTVTTGSLIAIVILFAIGSVPVWMRALAGLAGLSLTAWIAWLGWAWPAIEHRRMGWRVTPLRVEIRRGVVWRTTISVPRARIQHTDVSQGPLERRFGLATLHLYTAGTEHSRVELPGLAHEDAERTREHLVVGGEDDAV